jgi:hypothetical protein
MAFILQYGFMKQFGDATGPYIEKFSNLIGAGLGAWYSAFIQNLIMSILFIQMLYTRRNSKGQNQLIAVSKWIGTLAPTIMFGVILENRLVLMLGIFCSIFDLIYIWALRKFSKEGLIVS